MNYKIQNYLEAAIENDFFIPDTSNLKVGDIVKIGCVPLDGKASETFWVEIIHIETENINAIVRNDLQVIDLKFGDPIQVKAENIREIKTETP